MMPKTKKSVCDLCTDTLEKGQDILNCEGDCNCTVHRYCAGVTAGHFLALAKSSSPFICQWCMLKTTNAVIKQLQSDVASLKNDLASVRAELSKKDETNAVLKNDLASVRAEMSKKDETNAVSVSSLKSELASLKDQVSRDRKTNTASYASAVTTKKTPSVHPRHRTRNNHNLAATTVAQTAAIGERQEQLPNTSQNLKSGKTKSLVKVVGARKIWGTLKACTHTTVLSTISKLLPSQSKLSLTVKRKTKEAGSKCIWWYVIHGSESDLTALENEWERVKLQTSWTLEPCFMPAKSLTNPPQESNSAASHAPFTNESITPSNSNASSSNPTNPRVVDSEPVQDDTLPEDHSDAFLENTNQLP